MNWSNWAYLGAGLVLGMSFQRLLVRFVQPADSRDVKSVGEKDVSVLLQQIKQAELAYQMAHEMSQFKSGFLARTTHVLRSPLNGLIGLHQLILSNLCENPDEEREFIAQAHERALKLLKLIDEILNIARTEHGTNKLNIQAQPLAELLDEVHNLTYMLAENRNFAFRVIPPHQEVYILADPYWLKQVLVNLVDSAITQMDEGSMTLSCGLSPTGNFVYIWLDVPTHAVSLSEPINLLACDQQSTVVLPGMKLLLNQSLLEAMGGKLEIVDSVSSFAKVDRLDKQDRDPSSKFYSIFKESECQELARLQVSIPLVIPEAGFQE